MIQIIYTSSAAENLSSAEVFRIVEGSASNNTANDLTGFLIFSGDRFFQVVEGPKAAIDDLMRKLEEDPRHHSIKLHCVSEVSQRAFPKWGMKRFAPVSQTQSFADLAAEFEDAPEPVRLHANRFLEESATRCEPSRISPATDRGLRHPY